MSTQPTPQAVERLEATHDRLSDLRSDLDVDRETLTAVADGYRSIVSVLDRYEERATDWDDFEGYVEFRRELSETLESIPEDVPTGDAFIEADRQVKTAGPTESLSKRNFDAAREALSPAATYAELEADIEEAVATYREAYRAVRRRREELEDRIEELESVARFGDAPLSAPTERLREPIEAYNEGIEAAFEQFRREAPARELLSVVRAAADRPLIGFEKPPEELCAYLESAAIGEEPIDQLLEYADYSNSKLSHYVENPRRLKGRIGTNRTYLDGLSAEPLQIEWPPLAATPLRFRIDEQIGIVGRIADEDTVAALRTVAEATRWENFEDLRTAAIATAELTAEQRRKLEAGEIDAERREAETACDAVEAALAEYPAPSEV
ncbi:MAG: hypothetical protein PPP58_07405 [Natronomonas sp.]